MREKVSIFFGARESTVSLFGPSPSSLFPTPSTTGSHSAWFLSPSLPLAFMSKVFSLTIFPSFFFLLCMLVLAKAVTPFASLPILNNVAQTFDLLVETLVASIPSLMAGTQFAFRPKPLTLVRETPYFPFLPVVCVFSKLATHRALPLLKSTGVCVFSRRNSSLLPSRRPSSLSFL